MVKISVPENNLKKYDVIHMFSDVVTTQYLYENTPPEIIQKNVIIYLEKGDTYQNSKQKINELFSELNLTTKSESLIGIGQSSLQVLGVYNNDFKFFGLIDPLLKNNFLRLNFSINSNIVYNTQNWVNQPLNQKLLTGLSDKLEFNTQKEEKDLSTVELISYFLEKYKNSLI